MATAGQLSWAQLVAIARRVGVKVVEAPSTHRGKIGKMGSVVGVTEHTTGTPNTFKPSVDYPDFNVVKEGRAGLENSLSAYGIGRFEAIYVFSEYLSWHAGAWNWQGITDGNGHFLGIECAGVGDYTEFQRKVYPRLVAAILLEIGQGRTWAARHLDGAVPHGRKVDAQNLPGDFYQGKSFNQWVDYFLANPAQININAEELPVGAVEDIAEIKQMLRGGNIAPANNFHWLEHNTRPYAVFRSDPAQGGSGAMVLAHPCGLWYGIPSLGYFNLYVARGLCSPDYIDLPPNEFQHFQDLIGLGRADIDALAAKIAELAPSSLPSTPPTDVSMTDEQITKLAQLVAEDAGEAAAAEWSRLARDGDASTGPAS